MWEGLKGWCLLMWKRRPKKKLSMHSDKLALAFGLINTPKGATIRIMKNLRMCRGDCHGAFKLTSDIVERELVERC